MAHKSGFWRRSYMANALLAVLSLLLLAAVIDLLAFYVLDIKYSGYGPERFFEYSPLTGHFHRPGAEGNWYRYYDGTKFKVRTNQHGFADSERTFEKTRPRIALIGDSVVEFWEVEERDRGQYVMEALLDGGHEVMSFGVRGFGTDQTFILFENLGVRFSPDIVIYTFTINDIWDNSRVVAKPYFVPDPANPDGLILKGYPIAKQPASPDMGLIDNYKRSSLVYRKLDFGVRLIRLWIKRPVRSRSVPLEEHFELRPYKKNYDDEDSRRMEITTKLLGMLSDFAESQGMKFLVVEGLYKTVLDKQGQKQIIRQYGDVFDFGRVTRVLEQYCNERGIAFLSLPKLTESRDLPVSGFMHPDDAMHLNKAGIQFYSRAVVEKLRSLEWVP